MCLLSRTKKAEEVRTYYLELEKLLNNYKNYIIDGLQKTVEIFENNQKEVPSSLCELASLSPKGITRYQRM